MQVFFYLFFGFFRFFPKQIVQRQSQGFANADAQSDGGIVVPLFDGVDRLAGDAHPLRQLLLGQAGPEPGLLHGGILAHSAFLLLRERAIMCMTPITKNANPTIRLSQSLLCMPTE